MNWEAIGAIGEIVGATAVVVSLIYLATQIRQQNHESRLSAVHDILSAWREHTSNFNRFEQADVYVRGQANYDELNDVEAMQFIALLQGHFRIYEEAYHQHMAERLLRRYGVR